MLWWTLKELRSESAIKRIEAIRKLSSSRDPRAIEALVSALGDSAESVEKEAIKALRAIGTLATRPLLAALKDPSDRRRINAAILLRGIVLDWQEWDRADEVLQALLDAVHHSDPTLRRRTVEELGKMGDARAIGPLTMALCDKILDIRSAARESLGSLLMASQAADGTGAPADLQGPNLPLEVVPALVEVIRQHRPGDITYEIAGKVLERMGAGAIPPLLDSLNRAGDTLLRVAILAALGFIQDPRSRHTLIQSLRDQSPWMRAAAATALARHPHTTVKDALTTALKDREMTVRLAAAEAMQSMIPPTDLSVAVAPLLEALKDKASPVRQKAATLLSRIADPKAAPDLITMLADKDAGVRSCAEEALQRIGSAALQHLKGAMSHPSAAPRKIAARLLGKSGSVETVEPLMAALADSDEEVRAEAAEALRIRGDARSLAALVAALHDNSRQVRQNAAQAVAEIGDAQVVASLLQTAGKGGMIDECIAALIAIMSRDIMNIDTESLRAMADFSIDIPPLSSSGGHRIRRKQAELEINCSALRHLAREELALRKVPI